MSFNIDKILNEANALPGQDNWQHLEDGFKSEYQVLLDYMQNPANKTDERTAEIKEMDDSLCNLFYELHDIEDVESDNEPEDEEMKKKKNYKNQTTESEEILENLKKTETETENQNDDSETEKTEPVDENSNQPPVVETIVENVQPPAAEYPEFVNFASGRETISAKDLVLHKIPEALWKENKAEFTLGGLTFRKTVGSLIFNRWIVVKNN